MFTERPAVAARRHCAPTNGQEITLPSAPPILVSLYAVLREFQRPPTAAIFIEVCVVRSSAGLLHGSGCSKKKFPEHPTRQRVTTALRRWPVTINSKCSSESSLTICGIEVVSTPLNATIISFEVRRAFECGSFPRDCKFSNASSGKVTGR